MPSRGRFRQFVRPFCNKNANNARCTYMKNISTMTDDELLEYINHRVKEKMPEDLFCDYKATVNIDSPSDKKEFCKDVSGFANELGGMLLIGVPEIEDADGAGVPSEDIGIERITDFETRAYQVLRSGCAPLLPATHVRELQLEDGKYLYVLYHPKSWMEPHMTTIGKENRFFKRVKHRTIPMAEHEVKAAYEQRSSRAIKVDHHIRNLKKATDLMQSTERILRLTVVPLPIRNGHVDFSSPKGREILNDNGFLVGGNGSSWNPFGSSVVTFGKDSEGSVTYNAVAHPCGSFVFESSSLNGMIPVPASTIVNAAFSRGTRRFLKKWIDEMNLFDRFYIRIECTNVGPGNLTTGTPHEGNIFHGPYPELFLDDDVIVDIEVDAQRLLDEPDEVAKDLVNKILRLIGCWEMPV